jgi:thioredoxin-dependent peroxiredoxin
LSDAVRGLLQKRKIFGIESVAMLQPGQAAPMFELPDADMQPVDLSTFKGKKHVVLYFYGKDGTPGCTLVTTDFSDHEDQFGKHDCVVLGVSRDDCLTHADFRDRHGVTIALLSDSDGEVCRKYGVIQEKDIEGAGRRECLVRSTFIVDKKGVIRHAAYGVNPRGHCAEVFDLVKRLRS